MAEEGAAGAYAKLQQLGSYLSPQSVTGATLAESPGLFVLFLLSATLAFVAWIILSIGNYFEVRRNWEYYRCQPSITPFASFYGFNLKETLNFCVGQIVREHADEVVNPIYGAITAVGAGVDGAFSTVRSIESGVRGLLKGFSDFVVNFVNSFRLLGTRIRMIFIRMRDIFSRLYGIFVAFVYAALSAITFGQNLICNPLVTFVAGFAGVDLCCFAPTTQIRMANGWPQQIQNINIGQKLSQDSRVTAVFRFSGAGISMVRLPNGIIVSGNHAILDAERWIPAADWPGAHQTDSLDEIYCLSTTNNRIPVICEGSQSDLIFTDYEESSDPAVAAEAQAAAETMLGVLGEEPISNFSLGLDPDFWVMMDSGSMKQLRDIKLGDRLAGDVTVVGVVREFCEDIRLTPKGWRVSAAQLIQGGLSTKWQRAGRMWSAKSQPAELMQVFLDKNKSFIVCGAGAGRGEFWTVRDYQEWHGPQTQTPYDKALGLA